VPTSEERLLACAHHAPLYGRPEKTRLGEIEVGDDDEHPEQARDIQILTGNHRSGLKNNWHVNQAKILSFNWGPLAPNPNQPTNRLKPSTFQILRRIGENYISPLGFIERHREGRNNNNSLLSAGLKQ
jgi:hypothetical protein